MKNLNLLEGLSLNACQLLEYLYMFTAPNTSEYTNIPSKYKPIVSSCDYKIKFSKVSSIFDNAISDDEISSICKEVSNRKNIFSKSFCSMEHKVFFFSFCEEIEPFFIEVKSTFEGELQQMIQKAESTGVQVLGGYFTLLADNSITVKLDFR